MERAEIEARLREVGLEPTMEIDGGATLLGPACEPMPRTRDGSVTRLAELTIALPRISIDLGGPRRPAGEGIGSDLEVRGLIGEGGMGKVLLVRQRSLQRDVAVKTIKDDAPPSAHDAILLEGACSGRLEHPAIVPVHALGLDERGRPALVMKRIEGVGWDTLLRHPAHPGWEDWEGTPEDRLPGHLQILLAICNALHFAHSRGVVHRDVKPENVLIGRFGDVYLADWGIATELGTEGDRICGTLGYMAPEMARGGRIDARTDVYLLGATLHEILTGDLRHRAATALGALGQALMSEAKTYDSSVPRDLGALANQACAVDPDSRPESAKAFRDAVTQHLRHRDSVALAEGALTRLETFEQLIAGDRRTEEERRRADHLATEARFGLEQALERWPENELARDGLARLEAFLEAKRRRDAELEEEARERDPSVGAVSRARVLAAVAIASIGISAAIFLASDSPSPLVLVAYPTIVLVVATLGAIPLRRAILANRFGRELFGCFFGLLLLLIGGRMLGLVVDISVREHFARDAFMLTGAFFVLGVTHHRWLIGIAAVFLASGVACVLTPRYAVEAFGAATALSMIAAAIFARPGQRGPDSERLSSSGRRR